MDDDIYGDLEVSSTSSSNEDEKLRPGKSRNRKEQNRLASSADDCHDEFKGKKETSLAEDEQNEDNVDSADLDSMDLMDEGLTNKFKEPSRYKSTDYGRSRAPPARSNDVQIEKLKHEIAELKKINAQLEANLMLLYKTSHHLLTLKDKELTKLKNKYDAMCFRRNRDQSTVKSLPSIGPHVSESSKQSALPSTEPKGSGDQQSTSAASEKTSKRDMHEELAMLRNYLPNQATRRTSESSGKSQDSAEASKGRDHENNRRSSRDREEPTRQHKDAVEVEHGSRHDRQRGARRENDSHRNKGARRDDKDRPDRDFRSHREGHARDNRERKSDRERRDWRRSPDPFHGRGDTESGGRYGSRYRKRRIKPDIENSSKRPRRQDRRTPEDSSRNQSAKGDPEEAPSKKQRCSSTSHNADGKPLKTSHSDNLNRLTPTKRAEQKVTEHTTEEEPAKGAVVHEKSEEVHTKKSQIPHDPTIDDASREDGEISDAETDNSGPKTQELRRSPRKRVTGSNAISATSPDSKSEERKSQRNISSSRTRSRGSQNARHRQRTPPAERAMQERGLSCDSRTPTSRGGRDVNSTRWSAQKSSSNSRGRSKTPKESSSVKKSPTEKSRLPSDTNENGGPTCATPSLRRSPRKTTRGQLFQPIIRSPHTSYTSPAKGPSESPKKLSVVWGHPRAISAKALEEVEDPRHSPKPKENGLLLVIPQYPLEELEDNHLVNTSNGSYRDTGEKRIEVNTAAVMGTSLRRSPRKRPRALANGSLQASCSSSGDFIFFDQLPVKQRASLDNDKPRTPTLSPQFSPVASCEFAGGTTGTPAQTSPLVESFGDWNDVHFTPFDPSAPPETPGKDISLATPVTTTEKNGKSAEDVGRILHFDRVT